MGSIARPLSTCQFVGRKVKEMWFGINLNFYSKGSCVSEVESQGDSERPRVACHCKSSMSKLEFLIHFARHTPLHKKQSLEIFHRNHIPEKFQFRDLDSDASKRLQLVDLALLITNNNIIVISIELLPTSTDDGAPVRNEAPLVAGVEDILGVGGEVAAVWFDGVVVLFLR